MKRAAVYARVSTTEQTCENQLQVLRAFGGARGWTVTEFVDHGVSGAKDRRPALDAMLADVRRRKVDIVMCTKLDRLARSVKHLVALGEGSSGPWASSSSCSTRPSTPPRPAAGRCSGCSRFSPSSSVT